MKRLIYLLLPLFALAGCATYDSGYYRERTVYRDGGYYYPAYGDEGDYYYGADDYGYDYDYDYRYGAGIGYGYGYSPFWGLDRYRCRGWYGCVPAYGGYYPYHYSPGWSFSIGNSWHWGNWGWYGGYRWYDRPYYRRPRPHYPDDYDNEDRPRTGEAIPVPKPTDRLQRMQQQRAGALPPRLPTRPAPAPGSRPVVGGERVSGNRRLREESPAAVMPAARSQPKPTMRRATVPVQPAPAQAGGPRMRYPSPSESRPAPVVRGAAPDPRLMQGQPRQQSRAPVYTRPSPEARPVPRPSARPEPRPAMRPAPAARPAPAPRPQVRPASQNTTSDQEQ